MKLKKKTHNKTTSRAYSYAHAEGGKDSDSYSDSMVFHEPSKPRLICETKFT